MVHQKNTRGEGTTMVGANVRARRQSLRLSQTEVARRACVSRSHLCEIEQDKARPSIGVLDDLAQVLETTSGTLLDGNTPEPEPAP